MTRSASIHGFFLDNHVIKPLRILSALNGSVISSLLNRFILKCKQAGWKCPGSNGAGFGIQRESIQNFVEANTMNWRQFAVPIRRSTRYALFLATLVATLTFFAQVGHAQQLTGSITGTVYDQSGAVVPSAMVTLKNQKSGDVRTTTSGANGHFVFAAVQPATYSITITAKGFKSWNENDIVMSVGASLAVPNIKLAVGNVSQKVTVMGGGAAVTIAHSHTRDLAEVARRADILVVAAGCQGATSRARSVSPTTGTTFGPACASNDQNLWMALGLVT